MGSVCSRNVYSQNHLSEMLSERHGIDIGRTGLPRILLDTGKARPSDIDAVKEAPTQAPSAPTAHAREWRDDRGHSAMGSVCPNFRLIWAGRNGGLPSKHPFPFPRSWLD